MRSWLDRLWCRIGWHCWGVPSTRRVREDKTEWLCRCCDCGLERWRRTP